MKLPELNSRYSWEKSFAGISIVILFFIPAICFYVFQKSIFYFQENNSLFVFSGEFTKKFICKPGGLLQYSGLFLSQCYFNPLYGSLAISVIFALLGKVVSEIIKQYSVEISLFTVLMIIPSCLLMILQRRFDHLMEFNLGFLMACAGFLCLLKLNDNHKAVIPFLVPFFFYVSGPFAFIILSMYAIHVICYEKGSLRLILPGFIAICALITLIVFKESLFLQPAKLIILNPLQNYNPGLPVLFVLLSVYFILLPFIVKLFHVSPVKIPTFAHPAIILFIFSATAFMLTESDYPEMAENTVLEKMIHDQDWNGVISHHEKTPSANITGQYYYNIALSETNQLCDRLFMGRQDFGAGSLKLPDDVTGKNIYYYYNIGLVNETHHLATESFIKNGLRPETVKFIIKTEIIRGNYRVASKFINILKHTLHYRSWAKKYEKFISDTSLIQSDTELGRKIALLPKEDFFIKPIDSLNLESVLKNNPSNHAAFEYKIAGLLFEKDLKTINRVAEIMEEIGYTYMPLYIGESLVEARLRNHEETPSGRHLLKDTELRFGQYLNYYEKYKGGSSLEEKMKAEWGRTFWYYYDFR